ncbi:2-dehydropantoate 2-reductase [Arcobacteraceae bacterium]|nr:2-dehydropantoate 2-reductase [Arcobacteraceae bacterium]
MSNLKIAIVGAGGIGGYIGAKLTQNDYDVTLIARGKNYKAIKENGLKVLEYKNDDFVVYPYIVESISYEIFDVIFITTKSYDFESACKSIETCVDKNTLIIPLSNGVEHSTTLQQYLPNSHICDGLIHIISHIKEPGVIDRKSFTFYLQFGDKQHHENLQVLEQLLNNCNLRSKYTKEIQYETWKKFLFLSTMSSLTSYFNKPIGYILEKQLDLMIDILLEIKKVANKKNIDINNHDIEKAIKQATHAPYESKTSMQLDFEKGNKTELESLTGYIVKEAHSLNLEIPQMQKVYNKLKTLSTQ